MASELESEVQAIDRSLLECSAEEIAGVSAGAREGYVRPSQAAPRGRNRVLEIPERAADFGKQPRWPCPVGKGPRRPSSLLRAFHAQRSLDSLIPGDSTTALFIIPLYSHPPIKSTTLGPLPFLLAVGRREGGSELLPSVVVWSPYFIF